MADVQGEVAPGFEPVRDALDESLERHGQVGGAFAAYVNGEKVVDIWGGQADVATRRPWVEDTLAVVFSCTKGLMAACYLILEDRGLDLDRQVADWWPELQSTATLRQLLNHRAGLSVLDQPLVLADFFAGGDAALRAAEAQEPLWAPGEDQAYGATALGVVAAEAFRRIDGRTVGTFLAEELAGPLSAEAWIGLPDERQGSVSTLYPPPVSAFLGFLPQLLAFRGAEPRIYWDLLLRKGSVTQRALSNPADLGLPGLANYNRPEVRALELPWANGVANARGLARIYGMLAAGGEADGRRYVAAERIEALKPRQTWAMDRVLHREIGFSQGFVKEEPPMFSPHAEGFGHPGAGGSVGWADPVVGLGIGYVTNQMSPRLRSRRCQRLCRSLYACLDG